MSRRLFAVIAFATVFATLLAAPRSHASCGSSSCPLDTNALNQPKKGQFTFDLSLQYIDQDQPRIGTRSARVGEIPAEQHDEVRTLNRIATLAIGYAPADRLQVSVALPYVSRDHDHLASSHDHHDGTLVEDHNIVPESWDLRGAGDVVVQARWRAAEFNPWTQSRLWLIGGVKLPTGRHDLQNDDGEAAELPVQPGSGAMDGIAGVAYQGGFVTHTRLSGDMGNYALVPWFASATYQFRGHATDGYRLGNELQLNAGTTYPLTPRIEALAQLNGRVREHDRIADEPEEEAFTGGTYVYASPGVRITLGRAAVYALVQFPLYQHVNALQLTSKANFVIGFQTRF
jgi:hypothetical protein